MNEDERKLMISMAKAIEQVGLSVKELVKDLKEENKKRENVLTGGNVITIPEYILKEARNIGKHKDNIFDGIFPKTISTVEHEFEGEKFKMDIKFDGLEDKTPGERMEMSSQFLKDMEALCRRYKISKLKGEYICQN